MDEALIARVFWGPRQESPDQIADKLIAFVTGLDEVVGETLLWSSDALPGQSVAEPENARKMVSDAFSRNTDAPHLGISQVYDASGKNVKRARITMSVGGYSDSPNVRNAVIVKWHAADPAALAGPILRQLVSAWDPDWGNVTSRSLNDALADVQPVGGPTPKVGYLSYLSKGRAQALPGDLDKRLSRLGDGGVIIGSDDGDGYLPAVDKVRELAKIRTLSAAFSATPTSRSKL